MHILKTPIFQWSAHPLQDNLHGKGYFYIVSVHTGFATNAGTRSAVSFDIVGESGSTGLRRLMDTEAFLVGSVSFALNKDLSFS